MKVHSTTTRNEKKKPDILPRCLGATCGRGSPGSGSPTARSESGHARADVRTSSGPFGTTRAGPERRRRLAHGHPVRDTPQLQLTLEFSADLPCNEGQRFLRLSSLHARRIAYFYIVLNYEMKYYGVIGLFPVADRRQWAKCPNQPAKPAWPTRRCGESTGRRTKARREPLPGRRR